jgi:hypothetical protein
MNTYHIRFNKSRGQPGRGSIDHVWRVFENGKEYIFKHFRIEGLVVTDSVTGNGTGNDDWNMTCQGYMTVDKETSTAIIQSSGSPVES